MNVNTTKVELISWIASLDDYSTIKKILSLKRKLRQKVKPKSETKIFGTGKHLIEHISDDFNESLDMFKEYQK